MKCPTPKCGQDHLKDGVLKAIYAQKPWALVRDYAGALQEILLSMQDDIKNDRRGAFITRLRDYKECYIKGLWVGLMATPEEIVHDASGAPPHFMLSKLANKVSHSVYGEDSKLSTNITSPQNVKFKPMDMLNTSTHMSALFLLYRSQMSDEIAKDMYARVEKAMQTEVAYLNYVSGMLRANKPRQVIIDALRNMSKS